MNKMAHCLHGSNFLSIKRQLAGIWQKEKKKGSNPQTPAGSSQHA